MPKAVAGKSIKEMSASGNDVGISRKAIDEPAFSYTPGNEETYILPGNEEHIRGDRIPKRPSGKGKPSASDEDNGEEDDFIIRLTREEFLNYFFDDLELPDLIKKNLLSTKDFERKNDGYTNDGAPGNLAIVRSLKQAYLRRLALQGPHKKKLKALLEKEEQEEGDDEEQARLEKKIKSVPWIDTLDLRYRKTTKEFKPATTATIFSITDCSGSMTEDKKTISRKFFYLLYLFLVRKYEVVNLVWIIHTADAKEVTEKEFFETRESGGTVVSSALKLVYDMIQTKYNTSDHNLYILQSSDGDNYNPDNQIVSEYLDKLLPLVQFFGYIQIETAMFFVSSTNMLDIYEEKAKSHKNLQAKRITGEKDIWPMFRSLFEKDHATI